MAEDNSKNEKRVLDTPYVYMELEDGIMVGYYKSNIRITLEKAKAIVAERNAFFSYRSYPALIYDNGVRSMDKDARDFFASVEGSVGISAAALVLKSSFSVFLGNFLLKISKPVIPAKIFTNKEKALIWLQQFKQEVK